MTPIEQARNLGPSTGEHLRAVGIRTVEDLRDCGWQEAWMRLAALFPALANRNCGRALAGAVLETDWRQLPPDTLQEITRLGKRLRASNRRA